MIIASYVSLLIFGLLDNLRGPFYSAILSEFSISESEGAFVFAFTSIFASLSSFLGEPLLKRWGGRRLLVRSLGMMGAGYLTMAGAQAYPVMIGGAAILGTGLGWASMAQNFSVSLLAPPGRRSSLLSGLHAMYGFASAVAPWFAFVFIRTGWTWRQSFTAAGLLPLLLAVMIQLVMRGTKEIRVSGHEDQPIPMTKALRWHMFLTGLITAFYLVAEISIGTRLVRWLEVVHSTSAATGSLYLTGFFTCLFLGRLAAWWTSPESASRLRLAMGACVVFGAVALVAMLNSDPRWVFLGGLALGPFYPFALSYIHSRFQKKSAAALGYTFGLGSMTVVVMHFMIGILSDHYGLSTALALGPLGLGAALALLLLELRVKR